MNSDTKTFTVADPRTFDGDPYEVAARAVAQAEAVARILVHCTETASIMARNAQLERNLIETPHDARAPEWDESPQGKRFVELAKTAETIQKNLKVLGKAAAFNPKAR